VLYATYAKIDLGALANNLLGIRERVGDAAIMLAVKANAYGHGAATVSKFVEQKHLADWLGVATVPEALELRSAGVSLPILKLPNSFPEELDAALGADVSLTVVDETSIKQASESAARLALQANVHLAIDTGMRRIGCPPELATRLAESILDDPNLRLEGVFTHLPSSDTPADDAVTKQQLRTFGNCVDAIQRMSLAKGYGEVPFVHASNSGAIAGHDLSGLTMVRPGILAYGYYPDATTPRPFPVTPVMSLYSKVSFVKQIKAGDTVSYGRTWTAEQDTFIATVPVGYADGLSRLNSNTGRMLVGGRSYPIVGRVCMDQTMLDLGPETQVKAGDDVVWLGTWGDAAHIDADELAANAHTISYEVTTLIPPRVQRVFVGS
jgi:alanine racemase